MGGRGRASGKSCNQYNLEDYQRRERIKEIIEEAEEIRKRICDKTENKAYKRCCCCGEYTIMLNGIEQKCKVCGWIDDEYQNSHPNSYNGPNVLCLNEARKKFGVQKCNL